MKQYVVVVCASVAVAAFPFLLYGGEFKAGEEVELHSGEKKAGNFYIAAGSIISEGEVMGDLFVAGGSVFVSGRVANDAALAGGDINVTGKVGQDFRAVGGNIIVTGEVGGEAALAGGNLQFSSASRVSGDIAAAGGRLAADGTVGGGILFKGGEAVINGSVKGDVRISADKVTIGERAVIEGRLIYYSPTLAEISPNARIAGEISYTKREGHSASKGTLAALFTLWWVLRLLMLIAAALVLYFIWPGQVARFSRAAENNFWRNLLWGLIYLVVVPVGIAIVAFTVVGIPLAVLGLLGYVAKLIVAWAGSAVIAGVFLKRWISSREEIDWKWIAGGAVVIMLIKLIPVAGGIICFVLFLASLGTLARRAYEVVWKRALPR